MSEPLFLWLMVLLGAYLLGSVPFALLIGLWRGVDIRGVGSGNIGATNLGRAVGRRWGALCFVLDMGKGAAPTLTAGALSGALGHWAPTTGDALLWFGVAAAAIAGHMFPVWLGFRGGKGVATGFGALFSIWPTMTVAAGLSLLVWLITLVISRYVGVSSSLAAASLAVWIAAGALLGLGPSSDAVDRLIDVWPFLFGSGLLGGLVIWKHRGNIARTLAGTEPRVAFSIRALRRR